MIALIRWKEGSPKVLPDRVDIPIGVELLMSEKNYRVGVVQHWLESEYKWSIDNLDFTEEIYFH